MCGIAGIITSSKQENFENIVKHMLNALAHRGPDGEGVWVAKNKNIYFGHRRLSIIDLTANANQPMVSADGRYVITYNGEIYNYLELRKQCEEQGSVFFSHSDTEVVLECFKHWSFEAFTLFRGMWALAIYDTINNIIIFSRDPFAIKPLYYGYVNGSLYFASEPKSLHTVHDSFREIDEISTQLYIENGYVDRNEWTFFQNIKRFPHAHYAVMSVDRLGEELQFIRYWSPPTTIKKIGFQEAAEEILRLLGNSIQLHLRSDVPVGACLSGGLDSSAIVCIGSHYLVDKRFHTFTTTFPTHADIDESKWANYVINATQAQAEFAEPTYDMFINEFDRVLRIQGEPFLGTSIYAQYSIFKKISTTPIKVILDGQGADEQFTGYDGFFLTYLKELLSTHNYPALLREYWHAHRNKKINYRYVINKFKNSFSHRIEKAHRTKANSTLVDSYEHRMRILATPTKSLAEQLKMMLTEFNVPQLLRYEDRNSMGHSIESRVPFLETDLVNFCLSLPGEFKIKNGISKFILREALKGILPEEVRMRMDKLGFPTPEKQWIKKAFNIDVTESCSKEWRELCAKRWRELVIST